MGNTKKAFNSIYLGFALIKLDIGIAKKYIRNDAKTEVKIKIDTTFFLKAKILVHFSCEAKEAIKRIDVVSNPTLANNVKIPNTVIAKT